jgi:Tfp pilus assembly protein PilN
VSNVSLTFEHAHIKPLPNIKSIYENDHELFAMATSDSSELNFVPFEIFQKHAKVHSLWVNAIKALQMILVLSIGIFTLIATTNGLQALAHQTMHESFVELDLKRKTVSTEKARLDSLYSVLSEKAQFLQKESSITRLLNDLQDVFPEGMWAEEISLSETSTTTWGVQIRALSQSSELLNTFNDNLRKTPNISNVRMVYSETTKVKNNPKTILRVKVECTWK